MAEPAAVNASPLICLGRAGLLDLLRLAAPAVVVPTTVADEIARGTGGDRLLASMRQESWLSVVEPPPISPTVAAWDLGAGESGVLAWASGHPGAVAILDDKLARRCAAALGVPTRGTLGLVLTAKQRGAAPAARPLVDKLRREGLYLSEGLVQQALKLVGE